jgi:hypothetical protein
MQVCYLWEDTSVSLDIFVGLQGLLLHAEIGSRDTVEGCRRLRLQGLLLHVEIGSRATALGSRRLQPGG